MDVKDGHHTSACTDTTSGGSPDSRAKVGHVGAAGTNSTCPPAGGNGFPVQTLSSTVGGGAMGTLPVACGTSPIISQPPANGQNGHALLTW